MLEILQGKTCFWVKSLQYEKGKMMKPASHQSQNLSLFNASLDKIINRTHPLALLSKKIDWDGLAKLLARHYIDFGRPGLSLRLLVGMNFLKYIYNLSDEALCKTWVENPYYQYFCGEVSFQHKLPMDRSTMSRFRDRIGEEDLSKLLQESLRVAHAVGALDLKSCDKIVIDTTVQEKAITYPTDGKLRYKAIERLGAFCKKQGIDLRQSYIRVAKLSLQKSLRYRHAKQHNRAKRCEKQLKTWLGRMIRDVERKWVGERSTELNNVMSKAVKIWEMAKERRIYSWHAAEVECIGKGKPQKPYEFGCKVSIATNAMSAAGGHFILHAQAMPGKPYDGHTLSAAIANVTENVGREPKRFFVDRGYIGHDYEHKTRVYRSGQKRGVTAQIKRELRRRSVVEPIIGHAKHDNRMAKNWLKGEMGDKINASFAATGYNFSRILAWLAILLPIFWEFITDFVKDNLHNKNIQQYQGIPIN